MRAKLITLIITTISYLQSEATSFVRQDSTISLSETEIQFLKADSLKQMNQFQPALEFWEYTLSDFKTNNKDRVRALNESADLFREINNLANTKERLIEAREQLPTDTEYQDLLSQNYLFWGRYHSKMNNLDSALQYFRKAAFLAESIGYSDVEFMSWAELGNYYRINSENDLAAVYYFNKAISLSEANKVEMPLLEAKTSYAIALTSSELNEKEKAIDYSLEAIQIMDSLDEAIHYEFLADINYLLATLNLSLSEPEDAIIHLKEALRLTNTYAVDEESNKSKQYYPDLSRAYEAIHLLDSAIIIEEKLSKIAPQGENGPGSMLQLRLGNLYRKQGNLAKAYQIGNAFREFHQIESESGSLNRFEANVTLGDYFVAAQVIDSSVYYYQKGLKSIDPSLSIENVLEKIKNGSIERSLQPRAVTMMEKLAIATLGSTELSKEKLEVTLEMIEASLEYSRSITSTSNLSEIQILSDQMANFHLLTEYALEASYQLYYLTKDKKYRTTALRLIENDKLINIRREAAEAMFLNHMGLPDSLKTSFEQLNQEILDRIDELELAINDDEKYNRENLLIGSFDKMMKWRKRAKTYLEKSSTQYSLFDDINFMDFHDHGDIHLIEYFYGTKNVFGLSVSDSSSVFLQRAISAEFEGEIHRFLSHFWKTPEVFSQTEMDDFIESSTRLYNNLVKPLMPALPSTKTVIIAPDGLIMLIPFETLLTEAPSAPTGYQDLSYLLKSASVSYISSAEMLLDLPPSLPKYNSQLTSFALKSRFSSDDVSSTYILQEIKNSRLYFEGMTFRGRQATKDAFIRLAPNFEILYLLIHGDAIDYPKLIFNPGKTTNIERNLYTHEIYNLNLRGNVIVLTSTETGMGLIPHGEAVLSMVRAFLSAGSGAVVLGLWEAHDEHSKNIVQSFFRRLSLGDNTLHALRSSKLEYLSTADQLSAHPHNWAELISYGEPVQVTIEKDSGYLAWILIFFISIAILTALSGSREEELNKLETEKQDQLKQVQ